MSVPHTKPKLTKREKKSLLANDPVRQRALQNQTAKKYEDSQNNNTQKSITGTTAVPPVIETPAQYVSKKDFEAVFGEGRTYEDTLKKAEQTLHFSIRQKDYYTFKNVLHGNAEFNSSTVIEATGQSLCQAAHGWEAYDILLYLLTQKPDVNYATEKNPPLLVDAMKKQDIVYTKKLLSLGANVNYIDSEGLTPLHHLKRNVYIEKQAQHRIVEMVDCVFKAGYKEELLHSGETSFFSLAVGKYFDSVPEYLIDKINNINILQKFSKDIESLRRISNTLSFEDKLDELNATLQSKLTALIEKTALEQSIAIDSTSNALKSSAIHKI